MSAELNVQVKLNLLEGEVKGLAEKVNKSIGGILNRPLQPSQSPQIREEDKKAVEKLKQLNKQGISLADAAAGMLRSLLIYRAISETLKMFKAALDSITSSFEKAKKLYVGGALSGFGTKLQANRTSVAQILGVNENDLMRFGEAYKTYSRKIEIAINAISKNARTLAETNMQFEVMKVKVSAVASDLATKLKPAFDHWIEGVEIMADWMLKHFPGIGNQSKTEAFSNQYQQNSQLFDTLAQKMNRYSVYGRDKYGNQNYNEIIGALSKHSEKSRKLLYKESGIDISGQTVIERLLKEYKGLGKESKGLTPQMKQLGASAWEKMGLVIGGTGGTNYAQQTATNTKNTSNLLKELKKSLDSQQRGGNVFQSHPSLA
jgi:hypothetical protein